MSVVIVQLDPLGNWQEAPPTAFISTVAGGQLPVWSLEPLELHKAYMFACSPQPQVPDMLRGQVTVLPSGFDDKGNITGFSASYDQGAHDKNQDELAAWDRKWQAYKVICDEILVEVNDLLTRGKN